MEVISKMVRCICAIAIRLYFTDLVSKEPQNSNIRHDHFTTSLWSDDVFKVHKSVLLECLRLSVIRV